MVDITFRGLSRIFNGVAAVNDISATFPSGSVTCLLGPSGCGKTTLMRMIAGLETPSRGQILFGSRDVTKLTPRARNIAMVFQYPVMYRTLTVEENIALPLGRDRGLSVAERRHRVDEVLEVLQLTALRRGRMEELDIGTRQRVAVGRSIARRCDVILFDEPTTNVEVHAKLELIRAFKLFREKLRQTVIYVTHDQTEAMTLADQIALMQAGVISQCAAPRTLYERPESEFGGWFLGNPGMNFIAPRVRGDGALDVDLLAHPLAMPDGGAETLRLGFRPERVEVTAPGAAGSLTARVERRFITIGGQYLLTLLIGETRLRARASAEVARYLGDTAGLRCHVADMAFFRDGQRLGEAPRALAPARPDLQSALPQ
jgi:ABC-type sugar transport system ATPase subunit